MNEDLETESFDDGLELVLAEAAVAAGGEWPRAEVRQRLMASLQPALPAGFRVRTADEGEWLPHGVPGIRMKVLSVNRDRDYATLLLDVSPGARFPAHHHAGAEECYVIAGSLHTCGRRLGPGDFVHADADTDHGELWTEDGCQVLLVVPLDEQLAALAP